jgi:hypothetical protein
MAPVSGRTVRANQILLEFEKLTEELKDTPYGDLPKEINARGWLVYLLEKPPVPTPFGTVLMSYDIMVGKRDEPGVPLERIDQLTMNLGGNMLALSYIARDNILPTAILMLIGRRMPAVSPPQSDQAPAARPNGSGAAVAAEKPVEIDANDADVTIQENLPLRGEPNLIGKVTPDGLPLFELYESGERPEIIIEALKRTLRDEAAKIGTDEGLQSLAKLNMPTMVSFIEDFGGDRAADHIGEIQAIFGERQREILQAQSSVRRRSSRAN